MRLSVFQSPLFETFFRKNNSFLCSLCYLIHTYLSSCANHKILSTKTLQKTQVWKFKSANENRSMWTQSGSRNLWFFFPLVLLLSSHHQKIIKWQLVLFKMKSFHSHDDDFTRTPFLNKKVFIWWLLSDKSSAREREDELCRSQPGAKCLWNML